MLKDNDDLEVEQFNLLGHSFNHYPVLSNYYLDQTISH